MLPSGIRSKMEKKVDQKLDTLEKYVPFINYLLQLDNEKYKKFIDIRQWISNRKRYPMDVLEKIEQSIITQYRNLFLEDGKVPTHIMDIFNTHAQSEAKCYRVNLCSDDEEGDENASDDDVVIVCTTATSENKPNATKKISPASKKPTKVKPNETKNKESSKDSVPLEEPICLDSDDDEIDLDSTITSVDSFYQEEKLFKRRKDFKTEEDMESIDRQLAVVDKIDEILENQKNLDEGNLNLDDEPIYMGEIEVSKRKETPDQASEEAVLDQTKVIDPQKTEHRTNKAVKEQMEAKQQSSKVSEHEVTELLEYNNDLNEERNNNEQFKPQSGKISGSRININIEDINEETLENMDVENLKKIYEDLTRECQIDVEKLLKSINLVGSPNATNQNNIFNQSTSTYTLEQHPQQQKLLSQHSPQYENVGMRPYPQLKRIETIMPKVVGLPPQPFKLNLKDPRILKLLERNNNLPNLPMPSTVSRSKVDTVTNKIEVPKHAPLTYGEYKRIKAEQAERKKAEEARKLEDAKRVEEIRKQEEMKAKEQLKKQEEKSREEEKQKSETLGNQEEPRRAEEIEMPRDEVKKTAVLTSKAEEEKKLENLEQTVAIEILKDFVAKPNANKIQNSVETLVENIPDLKNAIFKTIGEQLLENEKFLKLLEVKHKKPVDTNDKAVTINKEPPLEAKRIHSDERFNSNQNNTITTTSSANKINTNNQDSAKSKSSSNSMPKSAITSDISTPQNPYNSITEPQTDLKSIILNTILPYSDKILDVLRKNISDVKPKSENQKPEQREAESTSIDDSTVRLNANVSEPKQGAKMLLQQQQDVNTNTDCTNHFLSKEEQNSKKKRKRKEAKVKHTFKRIRTISSSSSSSSASISSPSPLRPATSYTCPAPSLSTLSSPPSSSSLSSSLSSTTTRSVSATPLKTSNKINQILCEPVVKLRRLSPETILKYSQHAREFKKVKTINIHLVEDVTKTKKTEHHLIESKPAKLNVKYKNTDSLMVSQNTTFCVLCKSRPCDLTNHYKKVHKTESYVARLSKAILQNLETNIPFVKLLTKKTNCLIKKYSLKCTFCEDVIEDKFINFYKHFSKHTGEYAFQCSVCNLEKPYEFDIQSHKCHTKMCRNARIKLLYQYPPNVLVIYLYSCKICNFVQLNEANTFKHLRDHHDKRQDDSNFIRKYILAAINDEETNDANETELDTKFEFPKDEEDILVRNEALSEEIQESARIENEPVERINTTIPKSESIAKKNEENASSSSSPMVILGPTISPANIQSNVDVALNKVIDRNLFDLNCQSLIKSTNENDKHDSLLSEIDSLFYEANVTSNLNCIKTECPYSVPPDDTVPLRKEHETSIKKHLLNSYHTSYRHYPNGAYYYGLFKCMATDCLYSTDSTPAMLHHLNAHRKSQRPPEGYLLCAYCQLDAEVCNTPEMLIAHVQKNHQQSLYQCSICCYRAIEPSYILAHAQYAHSLVEKALIYKCTSLDYIINNSMPTNIEELLNENVEPLICPFKDCGNFFQSTSWLQEHLISIHSLHKKSEYFANLEKYACIYCSQKLRDIEVVKRHLVESHPDQPAYACERVLRPGKKEDVVQNLNVIFILMPEVPCENIQQVVVKQEFETCYNDSPTSHKLDDEFLKLYGDTASLIDPDTSNQIESEMKPNVEQLIQTAEECVKISVLKLIGSTGIAPNLLYHCPQTTCGGFFSNYDLWYRHMSVRHCCIISVCPHCPNDKKEELPLSDFKVHFEQHSCHLYGCFYCGKTFSNEQASRDHVLLSHLDINSTELELKIETVPLYFNHEFKVIMKSTLEQKDRYCFLLEFQETVQKRCKYVEKLYTESLKTRWIVPFTALWLENFPSFKTNDSIKRRCICQNCPFQTYDNEMFYNHLRTSHRIGDRRFACAKCDFRVSCENWEPIIEHIKMHVLDIHICCVCSYYHHDRQKLLNHLKDEHRYRDVPIVTIIRSTDSIKITIAIVFAELRKTFSTIKNCFFCSDNNTTWDTYASHLKKAHFITLHYFCEICNASLILTECDDHFINNHPSEALRIRCQIATNNQLLIETIKPLKIQIEACANEQFLHQKFSTDSYKNIVKQEPCDSYGDDDVEMIDDEDIVIENDVKTFVQQQQQQQKQHQQSTHVIRCVNLNNLKNSIEQSQTQLPSPQQQLQPIQLVPELLSPTSNTSISPTNNNKAVFSPRLAIQSQNSNFTGSCNVRPVKILIRPNAGVVEILNTPTNASYNLQNI